MTPDHQPKPDLRIQPDAAAVNVPTFACIVYVGADARGGVRARVGNLDGIEQVGATERETLAKIVPAFKARIKSLLADDLPIPWIDPPSAPEPHEQKRFIPVHL